MQNIEEILKTRIQNDAAHTFVVIVPNDAARLKRERELIAYHPNTAVANLQVYAIKEFVNTLYKQVTPEKRNISSGLQTHWLHQITDSKAANGYPYQAFRPTEDIRIPDSTLSLIVETINRLKERGTSPQGLGESNPLLADLIDVYDDYEKKLKDRWIDEQGKHADLANNFAERFMTNAFRQTNLVVVEGFSVLSEADIKILKRIARISTIEMWFRTDYLEENRNLYGNIDTLVSEFKGTHIDTTYERDPERHQHVAENLFCTHPTRIADTTDQIKLLKPANRAEEVEQIAYQIQQHVSKGDCKLSDICVTFYNPAQYQQRIAEIFPAYGIPYSFTAGVPLTKSKVVKTIFDGLSASKHTLLPNEFLVYVNDILKKNGVISQILNPMFKTNRPIVEGEVNAYHQFNKLVTELCEVLEMEGNEPHPLNDYVEELRFIAKHTKYQNRAMAVEETVKILQLDELRSLEFDIVFLGDFVEGRFPVNYRPDPLLPTTHYRTEEEQHYDNRFLFYRVLKSFRKSLYLTVPQREGESTLIASPFIAALEKITDIEEIKIEDPARITPLGFLSAYGNYLWSTDTVDDKEFPSDLADRRSQIEHVVQVEKSREQTHTELAYEGLLTIENLSDKSREALEKRKHKPYSITELEIYAKCPFQYFVNHVLNLKTGDDEAADELSSLEKGTLVHEVVRTFYTNRRDQEMPPIAHCSDALFEEAKRQLDEIIRNKSEEKRIQRSDISEDNLFWKIDMEKLHISLHKWLEAERAYDLPIEQGYFEVGIGQTDKTRDPKLSCAKPIPIGGVPIEGKIDRIDIGDGVFNVIDYKTGSTTIRIPSVLEGRSLQLPIYLQIAKTLLDENGITGVESAAGLYHKIRLDQCTVELGLGKKSLNGTAFEGYNGTDWKKMSRSGQLLDDAHFDAILERVSGYVQQYVDSISSGKFLLITRVDTFVDSEGEGDAPITPHNKTESCNYCSYKRVCRIGAFSEKTQLEE